MQNYTPGQGYKDGYRDREEGKANMAAVGRVTENHVYWDEYNLGWSEADRRIIDEARNNTSTGKRFLVD